MRPRKSKAYYIALLIAGVGGLILGFVLGAKDAADEERDEADLDPEGT